MISLAKLNYFMLTFLNILFKHILSFCEELLPQLLPPLLMGDLSPAQSIQMGGLAVEKLEKHQHKKFHLTGEGICYGWCKATMNW